MNGQFPAALTQQVRSLLSVPSKIVITTHHRPDGDAMGSSLGLFNYLRKKGHSVVVITPSDYPDFLYWMSGNDKVVVFNQNHSNTLKLISEAQVIFCLDFNWLSRIDKMEAPVRESSAVKILVDHHLDPEDAFDIVFSYPEACSTSELIVKLIYALDDRQLIDQDIAECLYCGIMTDTNSFRYATMRASTHRIIADLMEAGAENYKIHERVYDNSKENRLRLLGYALKEKLVVLPQFNTAYISLSSAELNAFNFKTGDTEGLVNYALSIEGIKLAAFFSENDNMVKISFRSKGEFSVKELSSEHFEGGGHRNASGGRSSEPLDKATQKFLDILPQYKNQLLR